MLLVKFHEKEIYNNSYFCDSHYWRLRLPIIGGLVAPNQGLLPEYDAGIYTENETTMIVSRGIGDSIIPIRFNNRPEIAIVTVNCER